MFRRRFGGFGGGVGLEGRDGVGHRGQEAFLCCRSASVAVSRVQRDRRCSRCAFSTLRVGRGWGWGVLVGVEHVVFGCRGCYLAQEPW